MQILIVVQRKMAVIELNNFPLMVNDTFSILEQTLPENTTCYQLDNGELICDRLRMLIYCHFRYILSLQTRVSAHLKHCSGVSYLHILNDKIFRNGLFPCQRFQRCQI